MSVSGELLCSFELLKPLDSSALKSHIKKGRNKRNSMLNSPPVSGSMDGSAGLRSPSPSPSRECVDSMLLCGGPQKACLFGGYDDLEEPSFKTSAANLSPGVCTTAERVEDANASHRSSEASAGTSSSSTISFNTQHITKSPDKTRVRRVTNEQLKSRRRSI